MDRCGLQQQGYISPQGFVSSRIKRKREEDFINEISILREEMQNMCATFLAAQERDSKKNSNMLQEIQQSTTNIESSISFLMAQNEEFKQKIEKLEGQIRTDQRYITTLEDKLESIQQESRKANFEIKNVPKK